MHKITFTLITVILLLTTVSCMNEKMIITKDSEISETSAKYLGVIDNRLSFIEQTDEICVHRV